MANTENKKDSTNTELKENIGSAVTGDKEAAKQVVSQTREKAGQAVGIAYEKVSEQASSKINEQKSTLAQGLSSVANNLREVEKNTQNSEAKDLPIAGVTGKYSASLAGQIEQLAGYVDKKEFSEMVRDLEGFARRNPAVFIGGAFAAGLLLARFIKSSGRTRSGEFSESTETGTRRRDSKNDMSISGQQGVTGIDPSGVR